MGTKGIRKVAYYCTLLPRRMGEGAKVLTAFAGYSIGFLALSGFPNGRRVQLDFFPADPKAFKAAARKPKVRRVGPRTGFLLQGDDRIGAVAQVLAMLAKAGVDVVAMNAASGVKGRIGMVLGRAGLGGKGRKVLRAK